MVEKWNKAVDEGKVHICTCIDMCGWQPCPFAGREKPEGCPLREEDKDESGGSDNKGRDDSREGVQ